MRVRRWIRCAARGGGAALVVACVCAAAAAAEPGCPPEDEAVLAAYAACAAFQLERGEAGTATRTQAHAAKLRRACATTTSEFIGVDPYRELLDCAQSLAVAGRLGDARQIEPVAQAYRAEQMLRLTLHGGQLLDPARYLGRPADYERRRVGLSPPEERLTTAEFSVGKPRGGGWHLVSGESMPMVFSKDPAWLSTRPVPGQTVVTAFALQDPAFASQVDPAGLPAAFEQEKRDSTSGRFRLTAIKATHRGDPGDYCVDFELAMEERDNPALPGTVLEMANHGFACLEANSRFVVEAFYSERKPRGAASVLDDVVRAEAEAFLRDITVTARRAPPHADAAPPQQPGPGR